MTEDLNSSEPPPLSFMPQSLCEQEFLERAAKRLYANTCGWIGVVSDCKLTTSAVYFCEPWLCLEEFCDVTSVGALYKIDGHSDIILWTIYIVHLCFGYMAWSSDPLYFPKLEDVIWCSCDWQATWQWLSHSDWSLVSKTFEGDVQNWGHFCPLINCF